MKPVAVREGESHSLRSKRAHSKETEAGGQPEPEERRVERPRGTKVGAVGNRTAGGCSCRESVAEVGEAHLFSRPRSTWRRKPARRQKREVARRAQPAFDGAGGKSGRTTQRTKGERVRGTAARVINERDLPTRIARSGTNRRKAPWFVRIRRPNPAAEEASLVRRDPRVGGVSSPQGAAAVEADTRAVREAQARSLAASGASHDRGRQRFRWSGWLPQPRGAGGRVGCAREIASPTGSGEPKLAWLAAMLPADGRRLRERPDPSPEPTVER